MMLLIIAKVVPVKISYIHQENSFSIFYFHSAIEFKSRIMTICIANQHLLTL